MVDQMRGHAEFQRSVTEQSEMKLLTYSHFNKEAVRTMQLANQSAWQFNHDYIDAEHILMGLCRNSACLVPALLATLGVSLPKLETEIAARVLQGPSTVGRAKRPVMPNAKLVTEDALRFASTLHADSVNSVHLLLGLLKSENSIVRCVFENLGHRLRIDSVIAEIKKM